jgi:hypothetical protein
MLPIRRAGLLALASLSLFAVAGAQVPILENFAGNLPPVNRPALEVAVAPYRLTMGPDGRVYMINFFFAGVTRFDPANGTVTALPGLPGTRIFALQNPHGIAFDALGNLLVVGDSRLTRLDLETGVATDVAYNLGNFVNGLAIDAAGNIYTADTAGNVVRVIRPSGQVERIAGSGNEGFSGDGGPALLADLDQPSGVALDAAGNLYIADGYNHRIRRVSAADGTITTFAGTGLTNYNGDGLSPTLTNIGWPEEIKILADGSLLVAANNRIRRIAGGIVTTFAGNGVSGFSGDGGPATAASLVSADGFAQDAAGNVYFSDLTTSGCGASKRRPASSPRSPAMERSSSAAMVARHSRPA